MPPAAGNQMKDMAILNPDPAQSEMCVQIWESSIWRVGLGGDGGRVSSYQGEEIEAKSDICL